MVSIAAAPIAANQFFQGLFCPPDPVLKSGGHRWRRLSAEATEATQRLLDITRHLCTPDSGWPDDKPQTPENLLPYVSDEAEDLLDILHHDEFSATAPPTLPPHPELIADLSAFLLWAIAASSPTAMKLLEGISTPLTTPTEAYGIRLVPVLHMQLDQTEYALDLATQTHFESPTVLPESAVLPLPDSIVGEQTLAQLQQTIWARAIALVPALQVWQQGTDLQVLLPSQDWAIAKASLVLKFVPLTMTVAGPTAIDVAPWEAPCNGEAIATGMPSARIWPAAPDCSAAFIDTHVILAKGNDDSPQTLSLDADVTLMDVEAWQTAIAPLAIEQISHRTATPPLTPLDLVTAIFQLIQSDAAAHGIGLPVPCSLADFCQQIKWLWIRASHDLMPLMAGIAVRRLTPGDTWELGTLVTLGHLVIQTPDSSPARLDVSTGEWYTDVPTLAAQEVIHLQAASAFAQDLWSSHDLATYCTDLVRQRSPLLAYLMTPVAVDLSTPHDVLFPENSPQGLTVQFQLTLDFVP